MDPGSHSDFRPNPDPQKMNRDPQHWVQGNGIIKGTGTRDYNWLKVVGHDGSWLGESSADIQQIVNCPFNLY
jgi:hypothetical protein